MSCPHGEVHSSACLECVDGVPEPVAKMAAARAVVAQWPGQCVRDDRHMISVGDMVYKVTAVGWCCGQCAHISQPFRAEVESEARAQSWHGQGYVLDDVRVVTAVGITQLWCKTCGAVVEKPAEQINIKQEIQGHHARGCPF